MQFDLGRVIVRKRTRLPHRDVEHGIYFITFDTADGAFFMRDPRIARLVANALSHFDEQRYWLLAWCVMPNHVHAIVILAPGSVSIASCRAGSRSPRKAPMRCWGGRGSSGRRTTSTGRSGTRWSWMRR